MSKERELLKQVVENFAYVQDMHLIVAIQKLLAQPERGPLSDEEIYDRCCAMDGSYTCNFIDGVEWAEHQHGITGVDDE